MNVYCDRWNEATRAPFQEISPTEAEERHLRRSSYAVFLPSVRVVVHFAFLGAYCVVSFLDELDRVELRYSFSDAAGSRLFLSQATYHQYEADAEFPSAGETYGFFENGKVLMTKTQRGHPTVAEESVTDVSQNYSSRPGFGEYREITSRER